LAYEAEEYSAMNESTTGIDIVPPHYALRLAPFVCSLPVPASTMVLIVDDVLTSGRTMRLSIEAMRAAGVAGFGFSYSGC
jgi:hypothetical protein